MNDHEIRKNIIELGNIDNPRLNQDSRDVLKKLVLKGSPKSKSLYKEFQELVSLHRKKRLTNDEFYTLLSGLISDIKSYLNETLTEPSHQDIPNEGEIEEADPWDSVDITKNPLYDNNLDMDQQNPEIW